MPNKRETIYYTFGFPIPLWTVDFFFPDVLVGLFFIVTFNLAYVAR